MRTYWLLRQAVRPFRWLRSFLRYHLRPGKKMEVTFSGDVPAELAGRTVRGKLSNDVLTTRLNLRTSPRAGTIVHVVEKKRS